MTKMKWFDFVLDHHVNRFSFNCQTDICYSNCYWTMYNINLHKRPFTKEVRAEGGGGWKIWKNSDIGGGEEGVSNPDVRHLKKIQKQISFSSILNSPSHCEIGILTMQLILDFVLISNLYVFVFTFIVITSIYIVFYSWHIQGCMSFCEAWWMSGVRRVTNLDNAGSIIWPDILCEWPLMWLAYLNIFFVRSGICSLS
jgi:hypothetical protein